jgi:hypothetical protein
MSGLELIGDAPAKHEPVNDYEPKEPTAEELKLAGVTLLHTDSALIYLRCDQCGNQWATTYDNWPVSAWSCPNARSSEPDEDD